MTQRAAIINDAHANVAVDIHADGGPPTGRGFTVLEPVAVGPDDAIVAGVGGPRRGRAHVIRGGDAACRPAPTRAPNGLQPRDDLAGLNLATEPKVLIECGNMRNVTDAALLVTSAFQEETARALAQVLTAYLVRS